MLNGIRISIIIVFCYHVNGCADPTYLGDTPKTSGFTVKGICMVAPVKRIDETALVPILKVNANSVAIMPYAFCAPENPIIKYNNKGKWWGESDEGVKESIRLAHQKKLSVMLKPHLWIGHGAYTGAFKLSSDSAWKIWESSYKDYMVHMGIIADSLKVDLFCMGTELGATIKERPTFWNELIDTLKKVYHGKLTYAANWDDYQDVPFWNKLDYIGVDAYFPLNNATTPSIKSLKQSWKKYVEKLEQVSKHHQRQILFTEYGYRNVDHNSEAPWTEKEGNQNNEAQGNAFEALYQSFTGKTWFSGGYVWKWYVDPVKSRRGNIDYTPQDKPALTIIANWYRQP